MIFPVGFDLRSGLPDAEKQADAVLKRLQRIFGSSPLKAQIVSDADGKGISTYEKQWKSSVNGISQAIKMLKMRWNSMSNEIKFDKDGNFTAKAREIISQFSQLTAASKGFGLTLEESFRKLKKEMDDEIKAEQRKAEEFSRLQAQITRDHFAQIESRKKAEMAALKEVERRYAEQQRMYERLFSKASIPKGIDVGFTAGAGNTALGNKLAQYNALRKELDEIDRKFARIQATGAAFNKMGEPTARVVPILERRAQIEQEIANITRTAAEAQKLYAKQQADAAKAEEKAIRDKQKADADFVRAYMANREREAQAHARRVQQIQAEIAAQAKLKAEMQAMYNELFTRAGQKGVNVGFIDTSKVERDVNFIRDRYRTLLNDLNILAQTRYNIKIGIDKQFEPEIRRITEEINRLGQQMMKVGSKGGDVKPFLMAIQQLRNEIDAINKKKVDIFNGKAINSEYQTLRTQVSGLYNAMVEGQRKVGADKSINEALGRQIEKVEQLRAKIAELDAQYARLNAQGGAMTSKGTATPEALAILNQRKQAEQEIAKITQTAEEAQRQAAERTAKARELWAQRAREQAERQAATEKRLAEEQLRIQEKIAAKKQAQAEKKSNETRQIQQRIAALKQERAALVAKENTLANITAKLAAYNAQLQRTDINSKSFERISKEVERLNAKLNKINNTTVRPKGVEKTTNEFKRQTTYLERLIQRMALYTSLGSIGSFLTKIREVTAQFEIQKVALGAILQDQAKGEALFSQIKQFAIKSPVSIMELTRYTKQVAAYRIEHDKLFDTTKRLADVSVGLGVDMGRLVLAYGQVRAATYLRAAEVRQFTEAGVPLLELLAEKFTKLNNETVTTGQVMDMISKRMVDFSMVEDIFKDMTSEGGIFYNMQEKQGNTLYGMWRKLGDAASIMYDKIGNTQMVNSGMKTIIRSLTDMLRNWESTARGVAAFGAALLVLVLRAKYLKGAMMGLTATQRGWLKMMASSNAATKAYGATMLWLDRTAAGFGTTLKMVRNVLVSIGWGAVAMGVGYLIDKLFIAKTAADQVKEALANINKETLTQQSQSTRNFTRLADIATDSTKSADERKKALEELQRTYKEVLPQEALEIDYLKSLKGNYDSLTDSIRKNIAARQQQKAENEIADVYGTKKQKYETRITDQMKEAGWSEQEIAEFWASFYKIGEDKSKSLTQVLQESIAAAGKSWEKEFSEGVFKQMLGLGKQLEGSAASAYARENKYEVSGRLLDKGWTKDEVNAFWDTWRDVGADKSKDFQAVLSASLKAANKAWSEDLKDVFYKFEGGGFVHESSKWLEERLGWGTFNVTDAEMLLAAMRDENSAIEQYEQRAAAAEAASSQWSKAEKELTDQLSKKKYVMDTGEEADLDSYVGQQAVENARVKGIADALQTAFQDAGVAWDEGFANLISKIDASKPYLISALNFDAINDKIANALNDPKINDSQRQALYNLQTFARQAQEYYAKAVPSDPTVRFWQTRFKIMAQTVGGFRTEFTKYLMQSGESMSEYNDRLKGEILRLNNLILASTRQLSIVKSLGIVGKWLYGTTAEQLEANIKEMKQELSLLTTFTKDLPKQLTGHEKTPKTKKSKQGATEQDNRLTLLKEEISLVKELYNAYEKFKPYKGATMAESTVAGAYKGTIANLRKSFSSKKLPKFEFPSNLDSLKKDLESLLGYMERVLKSAKGKKGSVFPNIDKDIAELRMYMEELDLKVLQDKLERELKKTSEAVAKSKAAREFYDKIFEATGDVNVATNVTMSLYGIGNGEQMFDDMVEQIRTAFASEDVRVNVDAAIDIDNRRIDFRVLRGIYETYQDSLYEKNKSTAKQIVDNGIKENAEQIKQWEEAYSKFSEYERKRTEIINRESEARKKIALSFYMGDDERARLIQASYDKQAKELADVDYEEMMKEDYISQAFESLDKLATPSLKRLKERLEDFIAANEKLDPDKLKEIKKVLKEIDDESKGRGFGDKAIKGVKDYIKALRELKDAKVGYFDAEVEYSEKLGKLQSEYDNAAVRTAAARAKMDDAADETEYVKAYGEYIVALNEERGLKDKIAKLNDDLAKSGQKISEAEDKAKQSLADVLEDSKKAAEVAQNIAGILGDIQELVGVTEDSVGDVTFESAIDGLESFAKGLTTIVSIIELVNTLSESNPWVAAGAALLAVTKGLFSFLSGNKVRKANKEIERQQDIIESLEYAYDRLEDKIESVFGTEYVNAYNEQLRFLLKKQQAYLAQAEAERSKGKKADKDKIKEYEEAARDAADQIADMKSQLSENFLGTDLASAARDFASAWIDAYKEFGSTTDAIKDKFSDMMQNMVVESVMGHVMEMALRPVFDMIDNMGSGDFYDKGFWADVQSLMDAATENMNAGAQNVANLLESAGISLQTLGGEATGITRDISTASEESINGLAVGINTQNYYISQIHGAVQGIYALMQSAPTATATSTQDLQLQTLVEMQNAHLAQLPNIAQNTRETADRLGEAVRALKSVISTRSTKSGSVINIS